MTMYYMLDMGLLNGLPFNVRPDFIIDSKYKTQQAETREAVLSAFGDLNPSAARSPDKPYLITVQLMRSGFPCAIL